MRQTNITALFLLCFFTFSWAFAAHAQMDEKPSKPSPFYLTPDKSAAEDQKQSPHLFKAVPVKKAAAPAPDKNAAIVLTPEMMDINTRTPTAAELLVIAEAKRAPDVALMMKARAETAERLARQQAEMDAWLAKKQAAERAPSVFKQPDEAAEKKKVKRIFNDPNVIKKPAKVFKNF